MAPVGLFLFYQVVTLPEEPAEGEADSVLVLLRSPVQTVYQRRFRHSDTVQVISGSVKLFLSCVCG